MEQASARRQWVLYYFWNWSAGCIAFAHRMRSQGGEISSIRATLQSPGAFKLDLIAQHDLGWMTFWIEQNWSINSSRLLVLLRTISFLPWDNA